MTTPYAAGIDESGWLCGGGGKGNHARPASNPVGWTDAAPDIVGGSSDEGTLFQPTGDTGRPARGHIGELVAYATSASSI